MADDTSTADLSNSQAMAEVPSSDPSTAQDATETPTSDATPEKKTVEVVADPRCISWKYPPYCELCNVHFCGESNSQTHFDGKSHTNKLATWKKHQNSESVLSPSKNVLCNICWKEMNTQAILDQHLKSPAHLKAAKDRLIVQKLKEDYRQLRESQKAQ